MITLTGACFAKETPKSPVRDVAEVVRVRLPDRLVGGAERRLQLLEDLGIRADLLAVVGDEPVER